MQELKNRYLKAKRALFDKIYGKRLNPEQMRAVFTARGPLLVLAGAGSGKTTVLVNRIAYLIKYGNAYYAETTPEELTEDMVSALEAARELSDEEICEILPEFINDPCPPWCMLAITFTNKAAREIKDRLERTFTDTDISSSVWAGTFHSICLRILRKYGERLGYRQGFSVYDTDDKKRLIALCMKELRMDEKFLNPKVVASAISMAKDSLVSAEDYEITNDPRSKDIQRVYTLYTAKLMDYNAVDFDDIIMQTVRLLETDREVLDYYQNKFRHVCVDEYQDTNYAQFVLTKLLSGKYENIMVVGDDDQSIYKFRGATVENILNFDRTYPHARVIKLEQNYRSTENILNVANAIIKNNGMRHDKALWCDKGEGEKIYLHEARDQIDEGKYIIDRITHGVLTEHRKYSDYAVLYRINELARSLESSFAKSGIPYRILGAQRFTDRKEIKDILAYLSVIESPADDLRLKRIINEPKRKIGASTVEAVETIGRMNGMSMYRVMSAADEYTALLKSADKLLGFVHLMDTIRELKLPPSQLIPEVFERTGYHDMLKAEGFEGEGRIDSVNEFVSAAVEYEKRCEEGDLEPTLAGFLEEITLVSDVDKYDDTADAVVLMTVHSAKGLEFPVVFLAGMEDGIFPSVQNMMEEAEMSEERRLAYVAVTRAKERLYVTHAKNRMMYGRTTYNPLSSFIAKEVPKHLLREDGVRREPPKMNNYSYTQKKPVYNKNISAELGRAVNLSNTAPRQPKTASRGAESFGVARFDIGTRVSHNIFGDGVIVSAKDMGGDVLYEVRFDTGEVKRLMATFAKLRRL